MNQLWSTERLLHDCKTGTPHLAILQMKKLRLEDLTLLLQVPSHMWIQAQTCVTQARFVLTARRGLPCPPHCAASRQMHNNFLMPLTVSFSVKWLVTIRGPLGDGRSARGSSITFYSRTAPTGRRPLLMEKKVLSPLISLGRNPC